MARKKQNDAEILEVEQPKSIPETETANESVDNENTGNDAGTYDFSETEKTFAESQKEPESAPIDVDAILNEYAPKKRGRKKKEEVKVETPPLLIPGELIIHVCDNLSVGAIGWVDSLISKNPIDAQSIQELLALNQKQKEQLVPAANAVSVELSKVINANPVTAFFAMMGAMYVSNYMIIRAMMMQIKKQEK